MTRSDTLEMGLAASVARLVVPAVVCIASVCGTGGGEAADRTTGEIRVAQVPVFIADPDPTLVESRARSGGVTIVAAPGQTEVAAFMVRSDRAIERVAVTFTDATGPRGEVVPLGSFDAWVLVTWSQAGRGVHVTGSVQTAELLLKDEDAVFTDSFLPDRTYVPPRLRLAGSPLVSLVPGQPKRMVVRAYIPPGTTPGEYRGWILLRHGGAALARVAMGIQVLPIALQEPRQDRVMYYRGTLDATLGSDYVGERLMASHIADIRSHGFTGVTLYDQEPKFVRRAAVMARQAGLRGPLIVMSDRSEVFRLGGELEGPVFFYGVDEPNTEERFQRHLTRAARIHASGGQVMTAISRRYAERLVVAGVPTALEVANYNIDRGLLEYVAHVRAGQHRRDGRREWYYWQSMMEKPNLSRVLSGAFLWASGLDGICPYVYQHVPQAPTSPYDPSDAWTATLRMHFTTYPAADGALPTLQWEAIRSGIDDLRYIATLEHALAEAEREGNPATAGARRRATAALERVRGTISLRIAEGDPTTREPYRHLTAESYDELRRSVAEAIIDLGRTRR